MDRAQEKRIQKFLTVVLDGAEGGVQPLAEALGGADVGRLVELGAHHSALLRQAVAIALWGRHGPRLDDLLAALAADKAPAVRIALAAGIPIATEWPLPVAVVERMLADAEADVRCNALLLAPRCPEGLAVARRLLREDRAWNVRDRAAAILVHDQPATALPVLLAALSLDGAHGIRAAAATTADLLLQRAGGWPEGAERPSITQLARARKQLGEDESCAVHLQAWLEQLVAREVDPGELARLGTDLTRLAEIGELYRAHDAAANLKTVTEVLHGQGSRSLVLLGPSGCGKTALVHELVHHLASHPGGSWRVLRVAPSDLLAGTLYLGEWQTKVRELVEAARAPKKVLLYVPNLQELSTAGQASKSEMNVATMLAPHLESGAIAVCGEATTEAWQRGLGSHPELRRLFVPIELRPSSREQTRALLVAVADEAGASAEEAFFDRLMELADFYVQGSALPGRAVSLLRRLLETRAGQRLTVRGVLEVLHESTGIPTRFLDDAETLDLEDVRAFLEARVMGQPEAVDSVLDLVTLVKAGLTDDAKPAGVLLFVGPTGVGKTELARALAELLFGDPARLLRFDMSEYASYESYERLLGKDGRTGTLTAAVREHPFSVLLLDEIEKAHTNVFDLCLGLFDAGRLTDGAGQTVDFRRTIIILTSNIGAAVTVDPLVGFGGGRLPPPDKAAIERDLRAAFRPEFLNRLDRVVSFRPLAAETAERIARKELARVLMRGGIARRGLTIDVDPGVLTLLMRQGYSPAYGARPLKRTVERLAVLPVARAIAGGSLPAGAVLRLVARGGQVHVERVAPEAEEPPTAAAPAALPAPSLLALQGRVADLLDAIAPLEQQKSVLLERSNAPGFWDDRRTAVSELDAIHRLDHVIQDVRQLARQVEITVANRDSVRQRPFLARHAGDLGRLEAVLRVGDLRDAYLTLTRVRHERGGCDGVARLARMYQLFARRQGFEVAVLDDRAGTELGDDTITLGIYGPGAMGLLAGEAGLHQLARDATDGEPRRQRDLVAVEVLAVPGEGPLPAREVTVEQRRLTERPGRLVETVRHELHLLHQPTMISVRACVDGVDDALAALSTLLRARQAAAGQAGSGTPPVVRRYVLGPSPLVTDRRTGRSTGNLERVLRGELETFCGE